jgi:hypothetical protein
LRAASGSFVITDAASSCNDNVAQAPAATSAATTSAAPAARGMRQALSQSTTGRNA